MQILPLAIGTIPAYLTYRHFELQRIQLASAQAENLAVGTIDDPMATKDEIATAIKDAWIAEAQAEEARVRMQQLRPVATFGIPASGLAALLLMMKRRRP